MTDPSPVTLPAGPRGAEPGAARRSWPHDLAAAAVHVAVALALVRASVAPDRFPGVPLGEGWGRIFVTAQVGRWARGQAPWGRADLLAWPEGMAFWPTDPAVQLLQVPLGHLLGDLGAMTAMTGLLLALAGYGPYVLARVAGARPVAAAAAGVVVQLSPFVLRHGADLVLEALALGPAALAAAAVLRALRRERPAGRDGLAVGGAVLLCATTSPYYAVYLALVCGLLLLLLRLPPRRWASAAAAGAAACLLALLPLLWTESGPHGRLGPAFTEHGFRVSPTEVVRPSGGRAPPRRKPLAGVHEHAAPPTTSGPPPRRSPLSRLAQRLPGGGVLLVGSLAALLPRGTRRLALLALLLLLLGPEPWTTAAAFFPALPRTQGPLGELLGQLPLLSSLGNAERFTAAFVVTGALVLARLASRWPLLAPVLVLAAGLEARQRYPGLALPATEVDVPAPALDVLDGPTVFFPSGDPPAWHPEVAPKEVLFLAGRAGVPVAYDFGRVRQPADLAVQVRLAIVADSAIGVTALRSAPPLPDRAEAWQALPFSYLVILEDRLPADERQRLLSWLEEHATLRVRSGTWSTWEWPYTRGGRPLQVGPHGQREGSAP